MVRKARRIILYDKCFAHVFSRSIEKKYIFQDDVDFERFKELLLFVKHKHGFRIFHYCLMHTHFHLAVGLGSTAEFSIGMKWLKWQYTQAYNRAHDRRRGTVWQGRFNSLVIEDATYLQACGNYIEQNPVEAGIVRQARDWSHSSSGFYESGLKDELVDRYEWGGSVPVIPETLTKFFEKGMGIGSRLFQIQLRDGGFESARS